MAVLDRYGGADAWDAHTRDEDEAREAELESATCRECVHFETVIGECRHCGGMTRVHLCIADAPGIVEANADDCPTDIGCDSFEATW